MATLNPGWDPELPLYKPLPMQPLTAFPVCVASLVQHMMQKDRNARPQSPQELQKAILACLDEIRGEYVKKPGGFFYECEGFVPTKEPDPGETRGHFSVMSQFLRNITEGIPAETRSADNIHSLAMVLGAIESANAGKRIPITV